LSASTNPVVLAVACHDVGQYVKYSPKDGKRYIKGPRLVNQKQYVYVIFIRHLQVLGAKQRVMELMTHDDPEVRYQALSATQKYFAMTS
jgi:V-type H+-transporting ATPase subunit H